MGNTTENEKFGPWEPFPFPRACEIQEFEKTYEESFRSPEIPYYETWVEQEKLKLSQRQGGGASRSTKREYIGSCKEPPFHEYCEYLDHLGVQEAGNYHSYSFSLNLQVYPKSLLEGSKAKKKSKTNPTSWLGSGIHSANDPLNFGRIDTVWSKEFVKEEGQECYLFFVRKLGKRNSLIFTQRWHSTDRGFNNSDLSTYLSSRMEGPNKKMAIENFNKRVKEKYLKEVGVKKKISKDDVSFSEYDWKKIHFDADVRELDYRMRSKYRVHESNECFQVSFTPQRGAGVVFTFTGLRAVDGQYVDLTVKTMLEALIESVKVDRMEVMVKRKRGLKALLLLCRGRERSRLCGVPKKLLELILSYMGGLDLHKELGELEKFG